MSEHDGEATLLRDELAQAFSMLQSQIHAESWSIFERRFVAKQRVRVIASALGLEPRAVSKKLERIRGSLRRLIIRESTLFPLLNRRLAARKENKKFRGGIS